MFSNKTSGNEFELASFAYLTESQRDFELPGIIPFRTFSNFILWKKDFIFLFKTLISWQKLAGLGVVFSFVRAGFFY